jgi:uncharacterized membrane protein YeaQ/YmgE (transglycosylase-associated protein family)
MPLASDLPEGLRPLAKRQNFELPDRGWEEACQRLARAIDKALAPPAAQTSARSIVKSVSLADSVSISHTHSVSPSPSGPPTGTQSVVPSETASQGRELSLLQRRENILLAIAVGLTFGVGGGIGGPQDVFALLVGLIVGAIAKFTMRGKHSGGIIVLSMAGAFVGNFLLRIPGIVYRLGDDPFPLILIPICALVLPFIYRLVTRSGATR